MSLMVRRHREDTFSVGRDDFIPAGFKPRNHAQAVRKKPQSSEPYRRVIEIQREQSVLESKLFSRALDAALNHAHFKIKNIHSVPR